MCKPGSKVFHKQAKWVKLYGAGVVSGEPTDIKETLDKVRSDQDAIVVKWSGKNRVTN
jgi:hypothetical protein